MTNKQSFLSAITMVIIVAIIVVWTRKKEPESGYVVEQIIYYNSPTQGKVKEVRFYHDAIRRSRSMDDNGIHKSTEYYIIRYDSMSVSPDLDTKVDSTTFEIYTDDPHTESKENK